MMGCINQSAKLENRGQSRIKNRLGLKSAGCGQIFGERIMSNDFRQGAASGKNKIYINKNFRGQTTICWHRILSFHTDALLKPKRILFY